MLYERKDGESLMISRMPESKKFNKELVARFEIVKEIISSIRTVRKERDIPNREKVNLAIKADEKTFDREFLPVVTKLCNLDSCKFHRQERGRGCIIYGGHHRIFYSSQGNN